MHLISEIDHSTLVRCEYEDEEKLYQSYYGRIAGRSKNIGLGKLETPMLDRFIRVNGNLVIKN
jgi:hypothetical protein